MSSSAAAAPQKNKIRYSKSDLTFYILVTGILAIFTLIVMLSIFP